jgi:hypothetical protein
MLNRWGTIATVTAALLITALVIVILATLDGDAAITSLIRVSLAVAATGAGAWAVTLATLHRARKRDQRAAVTAATTDAIERLQRLTKLAKRCIHKRRIERTVVATSTWMHLHMLKGSPHDLPLRTNPNFSPQTVPCLQHFSLAVTLQQGASRRRRCLLDPCDDIRQFRLYRSRHRHNSFHRQRSAIPPDLVEPRLQFLLPLSETRHLS